VRISGFSKLPAAGSLFSIVKNKKEAEALALEHAKVSYVAPEHSATAEGIVELPLIVKADVAGSIDAIIHELKKITHERAVIRVIASGVGTVGEDDVKTASAGGGTIIAFNVSTDANAREFAERDHVTILSFSIIYELSEKVTKLLEERIPAVAGEKELGRAKVLKTFSSSAKKQVLGARYVSGILTFGDRMKLMRGEEEIARGSITNLQQARIDAKEIKVEGDFGIEIEAREAAVYADEIVAFAVTQS
jgi:translation initiation factor IF-2